MTCINGVDPNQRRTRGLKRKVNPYIETVDDEGTEDPRYKRLCSRKKAKLNYFLDRMITTVSIDYSDAEIKDLQSAVSEILERLAIRVTERGILKIKRVQPCGSMFERTGVWKLDAPTNEVYTEFDYLAMLEGSVDTETSSRLCCLSVESISIDAEYLKRSPVLSYQIRGGYYPSETIQRIFLQELNSCFTTSCKCYHVKMESRCFGYTNIESKCFVSFTPVSTGGCRKCFVDKPTGTLSVNTSETIEFNYVISPKQNKRNKCSLVLLWNSKTRSTFPLTYGQRALPVYIDFVPALESELSQEGVQQIMVSKSCSIDRDHLNWRRSTNKEEAEYIKHHMADKHRECYKILKCLLQAFRPSNTITVSQYLVRMIVLKHSKLCTDCTDDVAICLLNIVGELKLAVEKKELMSFDSSVSLISDKWLTDNYTNMMDFINEVSDGICSITEEDSFASFMYRLSKIIERGVQAQEWKKIVTDTRKTECILQFFGVLKWCSVLLDN